MSADSDARRREVAEKRSRLDELMHRHDLDAVLLTRTSNFAWATGGGSSWVNSAAELGVATLMVVRDGAAYALTDNIEAPRLGPEELDGLGFEIVQATWWG